MNEARAEPVLPSSRGRRQRAAVLILTDLAALFAAGAMAYLAWAWPVHRQQPALYLGLAALLPLFTFGYAQMGLYPGLGLGPVETLRRLSLVTSYGFLGLAAVSFAFKLPPTYSRVTFVLAYGLSLLLVPLLRVAVVDRAGRRRWWPEPVLLVGPLERARRVAADLAASPHLGYRAVALLTPPAADAGGGNVRPAEVDGIPVLQEDPARLGARGLRVVFVVDDRMDTAELDDLHRCFRHVVLIRSYTGLPVEGIQVRNLGRLLGIEYTSNLLVLRNRVLKRGLDLVLGSLSLLFALPLIGVATAAVVLVDPGPPFFAQRRSGLGGRPIEVPKIRTMYRDAEARLEEHLAGDPELRRDWQRTMKLEADPRILPRVGRSLRRFSLDELPQLWSVVLGRMSLVGPRPFPDYHLRQFSPDFLSLRQRVRPGLTGLWQVTVRSAGGIEEQQAYDSYYIRNWSLWLDLYVLARTLRAVLSGKGAY
jgi:Undecaprenyl-phosphate galactose phosphotransferase WbaP